MRYGSNTKAAILRIGMVEIQKFGMKFFSDIRTDTFWQSSGFSDLITTCYAGRNRKCAEEFAVSGKSWDEIEKKMLGGQMLQGPSTCKEVYELLKARKLLDEYPLFRQIYRIAFGENNKKEKPCSIVTFLQDDSLADVVINGGEE